MTNRIWERMFEGKTKSAEMHPLADDMVTKTAKLNMITTHLCLTQPGNRSWVTHFEGHCTPLNKKQNVDVDKHPL